MTLVEHFDIILVMRQYCIYKATDATNGKVYIGQSCQFEERRQEHLRCRESDDCIFHRAIQAHGKENFIWEIIDYADGKAEANRKEQLYIRLYNSFKPNGYNMTKGGDGGSMWNARPVVCLELDGTFVKRYDSAGEAERIDGYWNSNVLESCKSDSLTCLGKMFMFEDEYLEHGARKYVKPRPSVKRIVQCDLSGNEISRFDSVVDASKVLGIPRASISNGLIGSNKTIHGFIFVYEKDFPIVDIERYKPRKKGRKVAQVDVKTGKVIAVYDRMSDAGRTVGISHKCIHKAVDKPNATSCGYKWISV